jgi:type II secretory pathway pseudopilin PulG
MGRKKLFSLIEIAVAMAIAAVGVAAIMALLPIAVKSSSDSVGDTLAADAANTVFAQLDTFAWVGSDDTDGKDIFDAISTLPPSKPLPKPDIMNLASGKKLFEDQSYEFISAGENGHWLLLFGQSRSTSSGSSGIDTEGEANTATPDFTAEVICWRDTGNDVKLSYLEPGKSKPNTLQLKSITHQETGKPAFVRVFVEISWPATKPYSVGSTYPRQSRLFVREFLDPTYSTRKKED